MLDDHIQQGSQLGIDVKRILEMILTELIPYLKLHCSLSELESTAGKGCTDGHTPEQAAYFTAIQTYVANCRAMLNRGDYDLPPAPSKAREAAS